MESRIGIAITGYIVFAVSYFLIRTVLYWLTS